MVATAPRRHGTDADRTAQGGFTLIELMVTIAVMALLALAALPFTRNWVDGTREIRARSSLIEAVGQARALAMRNPYGLPTTDATGTPLATAAVLYDGETAMLCVVQRDHDRQWTASSCPLDAAGDADVPWRAQITSPGDLALAADGAAFRCAAYDSRGRTQLAPDLGRACTTAATITVTAGQQGGIDAPLL
ncbi:hypothetical protein WQ56_10865 [Luteimonas sp. FCS-9]|nr:hypothetical protein WQ56_10865 [Luteimonas sp. FCS-9]